MRFFMKFVIFSASIFYIMLLSKYILLKWLTIPEFINHITFSFGDIYWRSHNFIPFKTIIYYLFLSDISLGIRIENLVGNIIGFIPFGFMLPLFSKKFFSFKNVTMMTFCLSFVFELFQLISHFGSFDVDDLILNTLGGMIGYSLIYGLFKMMNYLKTKQYMKKFT